VVAWAAIGVTLHLSLLAWKRVRASRRGDVATAMAGGS